MRPTKKIAAIFGTRPDTIKLAPIILQLQHEQMHFSVVTIATAQHRHMLDQVLEVFGITPDYDLNTMTPRQSLAGLTQKTIGALDDVLEKEKPDMVLVQGDTTTSFIGSLAAFYHHIPVGHVEAGLRTFDRHNPFPEEMNRRLISSLAEVHFAPTATAKKALLKEAVSPATIFVTGNSVIDALYATVRQKYNFTLPEINLLVSSGKRIVLVTMHRRENWGEPMKQASLAVRDLALADPEVNFIFPIHKNPIVRELVIPILTDLPNVHIIEPLDYRDFANLIAKSFLIITDSGGVQEEAPSLGKPVLVLREVTERPEAVRFGTVKMVGLDRQKIVTSAARLLHNRSAYEKMASATNPYGDGKASYRTVEILKNYFGFSKKTVKEFVPR